MNGVDESLVEQMMRNPAEVREAARRLDGAPKPIRTGGLTSRQRDVLVFCRDYHAEKGITPSYDEITVAIGVKSRSNVHRMVVGLEERGFIRRLPNRARSIELVAGSF